MIVYCARNRVNGKGYVGKTERSLEQRWKEHVRNALAEKAEMPLYAAIRKHGPETFELKVLQECTDPGALDEAEKRWIAELGTFSKGYNATLGGDGIRGYRHTPETRAKMSESRRGARNHNYGKNWGRRGPHSEESKRKISEAKKGSHHTEEVRKKIGRAQYVQVAQYDMDGNFIASFSSMLEAEQKTGVGRTGISRCCRFPHRSAAGFRFRYLNEKEAR